jgi:hypothetical protein
MCSHAFITEPVLTLFSSTNLINELEAGRLPEWCAISLETNKHPSRLFAQGQHTSASDCHRVLAVAKGCQVRLLQMPYALNLCKPSAVHCIVDYWT